MLHLVLMLNSDEQNLLFHILNLGHTYLHAIKNCFSYTKNITDTTSAYRWLGWKY